MSVPRSRTEIIERAAYELGYFTYNGLARYLYEQGYFIKLETIKRVVRRMKERGEVEECGYGKRGRIIWCTKEAREKMKRKFMKIYGKR